ncbi:hypothetical protein POM88_050480 [Heracleum sosnowskyi]|uniref:Uncharacterized protein n=1 Tax=Heracleum sosnowskyi TaxID=360622 RepID=A0AAD8GZW4_9APIA|nr:hypothetical protein POM88_050480 [Heracleum sosnowskyi]
MSSQQQQTSNVYIQVIQDVINKVRDEFVSNGGPGETVLNELQEVSYMFVKYLNIVSKFNMFTVDLWEAKMLQKGSIVGPIVRSSSARPIPGGPSAPLHDLNVAFEVTEEYETPTTELLFPPDFFMISSGKREEEKIFLHSITMDTYHSRTELEI